MEMWTQEDEFFPYFWTWISQQNSKRNWNNGDEDWKNVNSLSSTRLHYRLPRGFVTFLESKTQDEETQVRLNYHRYTVEPR